MTTFKKNKTEKNSEASLEKKRTRSYNMIFIAISLAILGSLGLTFIIQMDLHPGWEFNIGDYPAEANYLLASNKDILCYSDSYGYDAPQKLNPDPQWGGVFLLNRITGVPKAQRTDFGGPIKYASEIIDVDGDGTNDFLIDVATVGDEWVPEENGRNYDLDIIENGFTNKIISGKDLTDVGGVNTFSKQEIFDVVALDNLTDFKEDLICLEKHNVSGDRFESSYLMYLRSYFINGTMVKNLTLNPGADIGHDSNDSPLPKIELFKHNGINQLLFANETFFVLYNLTSPDFLENVIYEYNFTDSNNPLNNFEIIEDLDGDGTREIILVNQTGDKSSQVCILNGSSGEKLYNFSQSFIDNFRAAYITEIGNSVSGTYVAFDFHTYEDSLNTKIYKLTQSEGNSVYNRTYKEQYMLNSLTITVLRGDLNADNINEIAFYNIEPSTTMATDYVYVYDFVNNLLISRLDLNTEIRYINSIDDFDGDDKADLLLQRWGAITAAASSDPQPMFLSSAFPLGLGLPTFILLIVFLIISALLLIVFVRKFRFSMEPLKEKVRAGFKEKKITIFTITISVVLIVMVFIFFLSMLNVTKSTLIMGTWATEMSVYTILVMIIWFGLLTLTAAVYNMFSPYFAYFFIRLRDLLFKTSKAYDNEIIILDLKGRTKLGLVSKIKRVLVPLFLSLSIGFYVYNNIAPLFGYKTNLEGVTGDAFGRFLGGYMFYCILPLILSFLIFGFFNAGNYLLDDAGIVYIREPTKYRKPSDVEPISYWTQSIVKGFAGLSALVTFFQFIIGLDMGSVITGQGGIVDLIIPFLLGIIFYGLPFLTGFSYILLAQELMDFSTNYNSKRLYKIMDKKYDTRPREIKVPPSAPDEVSESEQTGF